MDNQAEVREFLRTRRARVTPDQAGLITGGRRRVIGLRREEVAMLASVSTDYYAKMERGNLTGVSPEILDAVAQALQLDDAETAHLRYLARAATPALARRQPRAVDQTVRPSLQRLLDAVTAAPTMVVNQRKDVLAANALGRALMAPMLDDASNGDNLARFTFFSPVSRSFYLDWEQGASSIVASLRTAAGQHPHDKGLTDLIGELVTRSETFRVRWSAHNVRFHRSGVKRIQHPDVGDLELIFEGLELPDQPGSTMYAYTTTAGSPAEERIRLLGSLAATRSHASAAADHES
jgi:transcriptional regulator with XRE-family HTH domain